MNPQWEFLKYLRFKRNLMACDEVTTYGCIADVLAIDKHKHTIFEYEFKRTSQDLKIAEKKKYKYVTKGIIRKVCGRTVWVKGGEVPVPHKFYFVVPKELWEKEKVYLRQQNCGVIYYDTAYVGLNFFTVKNCKMRKKNLRKYDIVLRDFLVRCTSAYVTLLSTLNY